MNNTEKIEMNIDDLWELWDRETNKDKRIELEKQIIKSIKKLGCDIEIDGLTWLQ